MQTHLFQETTWPTQPAALPRQLWLQAVLALRSSMQSTAQPAALLVGFKADGECHKEQELPRGPVQS